MPADPCRTCGHAFAEHEDDPDAPYGRGVCWHSDDPPPDGTPTCACLLFLE